ncbi:MAG: ABC transporter ATP-binding protein [Bacillota bacterium]|jgi:ABC-2 type transport system ATP-binding protein|nr:ABC transporter ATP-binding protein [Bacillota bacterium]HOC07048.1 ABC transporter ATP-binding protein [Bacillota bacterium]HPZ22828.1 ABC transporter ATP-binding protein [Bacillota bacterium]HQD20470.1 ABC transporter ATP-binding protein [Bacillota bacterium]
MLVEMKNLVKRYGNNLAVDNVNLEIAEGEVFGLLGPNGAGKTTIINMLLGLTKVDGGEIIIFGKRVNGNREDVSKHIGIVPQELAIYEDLTAAENVAFFGRLYGLKGKLLQQRVAEALAFTGLSDKRKEFPKKFSGGMKRRLNIACALMHRPRLIIMDEPTVGIDPQSRNHILSSVEDLHQQGSTIIYTSHYMEEVEELCTRIAIMDQGRVIALGSKEELKELVSSEERIVVELAGVNYTVVDEVRKISGVKDCILTDSTLTVLASKRPSLISSIVDAITSAGAEVISLSAEKPTLESVFLTLTGKTLRD